jgi:hypothetical protein
MRMLSGLESSGPFHYPWSVSVEPILHRYGICDSLQANAVICVMHPCDRWHRRRRPSYKSNRLCRGREVLFSECGFLPVDGIPGHIPITFIRWDEKAGLRGMRYAPNDRRAQGAMERRPAYEKE